LFALVLIVALPFVIAPVEKWIEQRDYGLADYCEDGVFCMALDLDDDRRLAANADLWRAWKGSCNFAIMRIPCPGSLEACKGLECAYGELSKDSPIIIQRKISPLGGK